MCVMHTVYFAQNKQSFQQIQQIQQFNDSTYSRGSVECREYMLKSIIINIGFDAVPCRHCRVHVSTNIVNILDKFVIQYLCKQFSMPAATLYALII